MKHVYCVEGHRDMLQAQNRVTLNTDVNGYCPWRMFISDGSRFSTVALAIRQLDRIAREMRAGSI